MLDRADPLRVGYIDCLTGRSWLRKNRRPSLTPPHLQQLETLQQLLLLPCSWFRRRTHSHALLLPNITRRLITVLFLVVLRRSKPRQVQLQSLSPLFLRWVAGWVRSGASQLWFTLIFDWCAIRFHDRFQTTGEGLGHDGVRLHLLSGGPYNIQLVSSFVVLLINCLQLE